MGLLKIAAVPPPTVHPDASVRQAVEEMCRRSLGAVAIVRDDVLAGLFTERDLMHRVVSLGKDPETTPVSEVMTTHLITATREMRYGDALSLMTGMKFRHLPIVDEDGKLVGILSTRDLYEHAVENLKEELNSVVSYFSADGPGGD